jgi:hypothetical protein
MTSSGLQRRAILNPLCGDFFADRKILPLFSQNGGQTLRLEDLKGAFADQR